MVQETSINSYRELISSGKLGQLQELIYGYFLANPDSTDREIADLSGYDINVITARRNELIELGYLKETGRRLCKVTKHLAITWGPGKQEKRPGLKHTQFIRMLNQIAKANEFQKDKIMQFIANSRVKSREKQELPGNDKKV